MKKSPDTGSNPSRKSALKKTLESGLRHLERVQEIEGGFKSLASPDISMKGARTPRTTTFMSSLILLSLEPLKHRPEVRRIAGRAATFLLDQRSPHWSWNYWVRGSADDEHLPCPDDLDDTFAALEALHIHAPERIDGSALASVVRILTVTEEKPGGPYNTWLVNPAADPRWHDVDPVVNANVAAFLKGENVTLPPVLGLIGETMKNICKGDSVHSKYYSSPIPALYFLSRSLDFDQPGESARLIGEFLLGKRGHDGHWSNPVETACAVITLFRCGVPAEELEPAVEFISNSAEDGVWEPYGLYTETAFGGVPSYAGGSALSTAVCLEALTCYAKKLPSKGNGAKEAVHAASPVPEASSFPAEALEIEHRILEAYKKRLGHDSIIGSHGQSVLEKVLTRDKGKQVTLLPYFFNRSFAIDPDGNSSSESRMEKFLVDLGLANLCGWVAYRIYDDFLDDEGTSEFIPLAAVCLREVSRIYGKLLPEDYHDTFVRLMDRMDAANAWERANTYFPGQSFFEADADLPDFLDYAVLADKSLPHCLGPLALLIHRHGADNHEAARLDIRATVDFFKHYIIARQLNDDAHDWLEDFGRGFVNSSGTRILRQIRNEQQESMKTFAFLESSGLGKGRLSPETTEFLQKVFWHQVMPEIANDIKSQTDDARKALVEISIVRDLSYLESLLVPLEAGADKALADRQKTLSFLSEYGKMPS